jgi:hypothetical protein
MKKTVALLILILISPIIAGVFGIIHDQITYTISPEYYTKFKFIQFGFIHEEDHTIIARPRLVVSQIGFLATWWMGLPIGIILGLVGLKHKDGKTMFIIALKSILLTVIIAFITGLIGLAYGEFFLGYKPKEYFDNWFLPENLKDYKNFISVGSMHNFSYLGGLTGLIVGIIYSVNQKRKSTKSQQSV